MKILRNVFYETAVVNQQVEAAPPAANLSNPDFKANPKNAKKVLNKQDQIAGWRKCEHFVVYFLASILNLSISLVLHAGLDHTKQLFLSTRWKVWKMGKNQAGKICKNQDGFFS